MKLLAFFKPVKFNLPPPTDTTPKWEMLIVLLVLIFHSGVLLFGVLAFMAGIDWVISGLNGIERPLHPGADFFAGMILSYLIGNALVRLANHLAANEAMKS